MIFIMLISTLNFFFSLKDYIEIKKKIKYNDILMIYLYIFLENLIFQISNFFF